MIDSVHMRRIKFLQNAVTIFGCLQTLTMHVCMSLDLKSFVWFTLSVTLVGNL
jgi:hypothetical protein